MPHPAFLDSTDPAIYTLRTTAPGPAGKLPLTAQMLRNATSGHIFGMTQNAGMGWDPKMLRGKEFLILSTQGGIRAPDGTPFSDYTHAETGAPILKAQHPELELWSQGEGYAEIAGKLALGGAADAERFVKHALGFRFNAVIHGIGQ